MTDDNQSKPHSSSKDQRDEFELDLALAEYVDQLNAGLALDYERIKAEHPQIAAELLSRLEAFQEIEIEFGQCEPLGTLGDYTLRRQIGRGGMDFLPFWKKNLGAVTPSSRGVVRAFVLFARGEAFASPRVRR